MPQVSGLLQHQAGCLAGAVARWNLFHHRPPPCVFPEEQKERTRTHTFSYTTIRPRLTTKHYEWEDLLYLLDLPLVYYFYETNTVAVLGTLNLLLLLLQFVDMPWSEQDTHRSSKQNVHLQIGHNNRPGAPSASFPSSTAVEGKTDRQDEEQEQEKENYIKALRQEHFVPILRHFTDISDRL